MASADWFIVISVQCFFVQCIKFENKKVAALIACELSGFTCTHSQTMNLKFSILHKAGIEISCSLLVNSCRLILMIHSLSALTCN